MNISMKNKSMDELSLKEHRDIQTGRNTEK